MNKNTIMGILTRRSIFACLLLFGTLPAGAQLPNIFEYLNEEELQEFSETYHLFQYEESQQNAQLAPPLDILEGVSESIGQKPVSAEALYYYPHTTDSAVDNDYHIALYNILRSVSTMEGIEYYSESRDRMRTLFTDSYFVNDPTFGSRIDDPLVQEIPEQQELYLLQEDLTFGRNMYEVEYQYNGNSMRIDIVNHAVIRYGVIPAIGTGNMGITLAARPLEEGLLVYGCIYAKPTFSFGIRSRIQRSLFNRLKAMGAWFADQLHASEALPIVEELHEADPDPKPEAGSEPEFEW